MAYLQIALANAVGDSPWLDGTRALFMIGGVIAAAFVYEIFDRFVAYTDDAYVRSDRHGRAACDGPNHSRPRC